MSYLEEIERKFGKVEVFFTKAQGNKFNLKLHLGGEVLKVWEMKKDYPNREELMKDMSKERIGKIIAIALMGG